MDGRHAGGNKATIPGTAPGLFPPFFTPQPQVPTTSTCTPGNASFNFPKNFWADQTKNLPNMNVYNTILNAGNMAAANGSLGSNLDSAWSNSSSTQPNFNNTLPLLLQQTLNNKMPDANRTVSNAILSTLTSTAPLNPLFPSTTLRPTPSTSSFEPLSIHPTPSSLNPPIPQPKQPPKSTTSGPDPLFPLATSTAYGSALPASTISPKLNIPSFTNGYDQLRSQLTHSLMSGPLGQHLQQQFSQQSPGATGFGVPSQQQPSPLARLPGIPQQTFDFLAASVKHNAENTKAGGFDLSQIFSSTATSMPQLQMPSTSTTITPTTVPPSLNLPTTSTSSIFPTQMSTISLSTFPPTEPAVSTSVPSTSGVAATPSEEDRPSTSSSTMTLQIPSTATLTVPSGTDALISPRKRRSGQNGDLTGDEDGLDLDLDDFNIFEGMNQRDQEGLLNSSLNLEELFNDPSVFPAAVEEPAPPPPPPPPPPPKPVEPPKKEEPKKEATTSAQSKMQKIMAQMKARASGSSAVSTPPPPTTPKASTPAPSTTPVASVATPPAVFTKPATPVDKSDKLTFTPPLSPIDLSDPSKPSTSGISSLIAASILPSELLTGKAAERDDKKKTVPVYLREQKEAEALPSYKKEVQVETKDDEFAFTDEDPDDAGEKLKKDSESEEEQEQQDVKPVIDKDGGMKYITKVGFNVKEGEQEPKKESKKPVPIFPGRDRHARQESLEFAEKLRIRRKEIIKADFANFQQCEHNQCAIDSVQKNVEDADKPPLPRLLIRLPKLGAGGGEKHRRRKKKKRHYYEEDGEDTDDSDDWYGGRPKRRRGRKPKRELPPEETYSVRLVDPSTIEHARKEIPVPRPMEFLSKKQKLMRTWREENGGIDPIPSANGRGVEGKHEPKSLAKIVTEYKNADARERLDTFRHCTGFTPRGTFLVLKSEINTSDCSLWRVDNMNLLQKFPGFLGRTNPDGPPRMLYKNSSTYSGWCEQLQAGYMVIEVKHVKNTRSETVVEPLIPVDDLFPAISEELNEKYCVPMLKALINKEDVPAQTEARNFILKDDLRNCLYMVIRNMLDGALTFDYFSRAEQATVGTTANPSWELLNEIECHMKDCEELIADQMFLRLDIEFCMRRYASCMLIDCELGEVDCQACGEAPVEKTIQLFDPTFEKGGLDDDDFYLLPENILSAVDFLVCTECGKRALWRHQLVHFRHDLARRIEDKLLESTLEIPSMLPDQIVDNLRQYYTWMKEVIIAHTDTWDDIMKSEESDDPEPEEEKPAPVAVTVAAEPAPTIADHPIKEEPVDDTAPAEPVEPVAPIPLQTPFALDFSNLSAQIFAANQLAFASQEVEEEDDDDALIDPVTL